MNESKETLLTLAKKVIHHSYSPYSKFAVGASILTKMGNHYTGVNIENAAYGLTLCAEASAIAAMVSHGEKEIAAILVMSTANTACAPCGACRQRIAEFADSQTIIHVCNNNKILESYTIKDLLPYSFDNTLLEVHNE